MGGDCSDSQFWDSLLKRCVDCHPVCWRQRVPTRCNGYCVSARCKAQPAHSYDPLLKKCTNCTTICGRHPAECSPHCHTLPPPTTTQKPPLRVTPHVPESRGMAVLKDPTVTLYSLLAVCLVLLFSSLSLALVVVLRKKKVNTEKPESAKGRHREVKSEVQPRQEFGFSGVQQGKNTKGFPTSPICPASREPLDDSIPTETCVCVHCFPDLKTLGQANNKPPGGNFSFYQPSVFPDPKQDPPLVRGEPPSCDLWPRGVGGHCSGLWSNSDVRDHVREL